MKLSISYCVKTNERKSSTVLWNSCATLIESSHLTTMNSAWVKVFPRCSMYSYFRTLALWSYTSRTTTLILSFRRARKFTTFKSMNCHHSSKVMNWSARARSMNSTSVCCMWSSILIYALVKIYHLKNDYRLNRRKNMKLKETFRRIPSRAFDNSARLMIQKSSAIDQVRLISLNCQTRGPSMRSLWLTLVVRERLRRKTTCRVRVIRLEIMGMLWLKNRRSMTMSMSLKRSMMAEHITRRCLREETRTDWLLVWTWQCCQEMRPEIELN